MIEYMKIREQIVWQDMVLPILIGIPVGAVFGGGGLLTALVAWLVYRTWRLECKNQNGVIEP